MNVRIGIADAGREVELELEDPSTIESEIEAAFGDDTPVLWVTDVKGRRYGIPVGRVAFVEIIPEQKTTVGFG